MDGGELAEALEDFTGGVAESYDISDDEYVLDDNRRAGLFAWIVKLFDAGALICAAIVVSMMHLNNTSIDPLINNLCSHLARSTSVILYSQVSAW